MRSGAEIVPHRTSAGKLRISVQNAAQAQVEWANTNPQRRARVMMKFLELAQRDYDKLAELLAREHGKTVPDAKGDIQRGLEVVEFACGIPHLMKGEYTEGAGPGIDIYSMRQPLGVVAGITPFNFPAMIPMWKFAPAIACGNAFILKPSERDPGVPMRLAELMMEAGLPAGILNVVNGDKEAVDAILGWASRNGGTVYGMCKAALERFTTGLAQEVYENGIGVNVISPGLVATPGVMHHKLINESNKDRVTPVEHSQLKGLNVVKTGNNLRDHMTDLELIFTMLGEASTTEIARRSDAQGFTENRTSAKEGGKNDRREETRGTVQLIFIK